MYPVLNIGPFALPTYPLFILIAYWIGLWFASRRAYRLGLDGDHVYNAGLYGAIAGVVGARLWFVLSHWENYAANLFQALSLSRSALSVEEGFIIGCVIVYIYLRSNEVPLGTFVDALAPGLALAIIVGNVGAFLGGVSLGAPAPTLPWSVEVGGLLRHPTPVYEAVACLLIFALLNAVVWWRPWAGLHFWLFVSLYSLVRLLLEIFRDRPAIIGDNILAVQVFALAMLMLSLAVMAYNFTREPEQASTEPQPVTPEPSEPS